MVNPILEINRYTEYSSQTSFGSVTIQIPENTDIPVQIIVEHREPETKRFQKLILTLDNWDEAAKVIGEALKQSGWEQLEQVKESLKQ